MKRPRVSRWLIAKRWAPLLAGGFALQLSGCDPDVRTAVLDGLETSITTFLSSMVEAFFLSLQGSGSSTSQPVVQAVFDSLTTWLA